MLDRSMRRWHSYGCCCSHGAHEWSCIFVEYCLSSFSKGIYLRANVCEIHQITTHMNSCVMPNAHSFLQLNSSLLYICFFFLSFLFLFVPSSKCTLSTVSSSSSSYSFQSLALHFLYKYHFIYLLLPWMYNSFPIRQFVCFYYAASCGQSSARSRVNTHNINYYTY